MRQLGRRLFQNFQPFPTHGGLPMTEAGAVAAWPPEARDEALRDRIGHRIEHDRDRTGCLLRGGERRCASGHD
jgi:hypothetical protein